MRWREGVGEGGGGGEVHVIVYCSVFVLFPPQTGFQALVRQGTWGVREEE